MKNSNKTIPHARDGNSRANGKCSNDSCASKLALGDVFKIVGEPTHAEVEFDSGHAKVDSDINYERVYGGKEN